jgi:hypothetical protein
VGFLYLAWTLSSGGEARCDDLVTVLVKTQAYGFVTPDKASAGSEAATSERSYLVPNEMRSLAASYDEESGLAVETNKILLFLKPTGRVEDVGGLLKRHGLKAWVEGQRMVPSGIATVQVTPLTPAIQRNPRPGARIRALLDAIDDLAKEDLVLAAAPNSWINSAELPSEKPQSTISDGPGKWIWQFDKRLAEGGGGSHCGPFGLIMTRFPGAWNFNEYIRRNNKNLPVTVGVLDIGRAVELNEQVMHDDLKGKAEQVKVPWMVAGSDTWDLHTLHVCGIIAARWNNALGIDGACPHCRILVGTISRAANRREYSAFLDNIIELVQEMIAKPDAERPKVINVSMGYSWGTDSAGAFSGDAKAIPATRDAMDLVARQGSLLAQTTIRMARQKGIIFVCAAGNDSGVGTSVHSQWSLPFNWAAHNRAGSEGPAENVLIVGAVDEHGRRAPFSNGFGHVAAPGVSIMSLKRLDPQGGQPDVGLRRGTSMSAPFVNAAIAQIYACYPDTPWTKVVEILKGQACDEPPVINAFDAILRAHDDSLLHLADLSGDNYVDKKDMDVLDLALARFLNDRDHNYWPRADLNGDGKVVDGNPNRVWVSTERQYRSLTDKEVMELALKAQQARPARRP